MEAICFSVSWLISFCSIIGDYCEFSGELCFDSQFTLGFIHIPQFFSCKATLLHYDGCKGAFSHHQPTTAYTARGLHTKQLQGTVLLPASVPHCLLETAVAPLQCLHPSDKPYSTALLLDSFAFLSKMENIWKKVTKCFMYEIY